MGCMELVVEALPRAVSHGDDLEARGRMLLAASMGATAFQKGLGVIHSLAHPLSTRYGIHHGLANALLMPTALAWQLEEKADAFTDDLRERYQRVARLFRGRAQARPGDLPEAVRAFRTRVGIEDTLEERGLRREDIPSLAREAFADPCHSLNPIPMTESDLADSTRARLARGRPCRHSFRTESRPLRRRSARTYTPPTHLTKTRSSAAASRAERPGGRPWPAKPSSFAGRRVRARRRKRRRTGPVFGQSTYGAVVGVVTQHEGHHAGATVTLREVQTNVTRSTTSAPTATTSS